MTVVCFYLCIASTSCHRMGSLDSRSMVYFWGSTVKDLEHLLEDIDEHSEAAGYVLKEHCMTLETSETRKQTDEHGEEKALIATESGTNVMCLNFSTTVRRVKNKLR